MDAQVAACEISVYADQDDDQNNYRTHTETPEDSYLDHDQASAGSHWQSTHQDSMDPLPSTLPELCIAIHDWQTEWEPKVDWDCNFNLALH